MRWFVYLAASYAATLLCYLTIPIVVLFCNDEGELPGFLHLWQTWDDSCDAEQEVTQEAPKFLRYDWHAKYFRCEEEMPGTGRTRVFTKLYPWAKFSTKETIQRYFCRCLWLYRNTAYGFNFYLLGRDVDCAAVRWAVLESDHRLGYDFIDKSIEAAWCYKDDRRINKYIRKSWYMGWKIPTNETRVVRCMLANRISLRFKKEP